MADKTKKKSGLLKGFGKFTGGTGIYDMVFNQGEGIQAILSALQGVPMKDGGRVRGCGIAKRGFGKAMKRKK
jgi:hypothetical protein